MSSVIYQSVALSKRKLFPGIFILHTPLGVTVDVQRGIDVKAYKIDNGSDSYTEITDLTSLNMFTPLREPKPFEFTYNIDTKKQFKDGDFRGQSIKQFITDITSNDQNSEYKLITCFQPSEMKGSVRVNVQGVILTFHMSDDTTVTTDFIYFTQGQKSANRKKNTAMDIGDFYNELLKQVHQGIVDNTNLGQLAKELPSYVNEYEQSYKFHHQENRFRQNNPNATLVDELEFSSPKYIVVQENAVFFILVHKQTYRPDTDYMMSTFQTVPYNIGFKLESSGTVDSSVLFQSKTHTYRGETYDSYYEYLSEPHDSYYILSFKVTDIVLDMVDRPESFQLNITFSHGDVYKTVLTTVEDNRYVIMSLERLRISPDEIGETIDIDDSNFGLSNLLPSDEEINDMLDDDEMIMDLDIPMSPPNMDLEPQYGDDNGEQYDQNELDDFLDYLDDNVPNSNDVPNLDDPDNFEESDEDMELDNVPPLDNEALDNVHEYQVPAQVQQYDVYGDPVNGGYDSDDS